MKRKLMVSSAVVLLSVLSLAGCKPTDSSTSSSGTSQGNSTGGGGTTTVEKANGAFNYVASDGDTRAEILGKLEKYALENHLTGIPLYGDGGSAVYQSRIKFPVSKYVPGFGFGVLRYGEITSDDIVDDDTSIADVKWYQHGYDQSAVSSLNYLDDKGSVLSDYSSYFTSSLFSTRLKGEDSTLQEAAEWYPLLASSMPVALNMDNQTKLASKWKIPVRVGTTTDGLNYHINSSLRAKYDGRPVAPEDYEFAMKMLLTKKVGYYRSSQYTSGTSQIVGASDYFNASSEGYKSAAAIKAWENVGYHVKQDTDGSYYIEVEYTTPCNEFNAFYRLTDNLISPIPQEFYEEVCGDPSSSNFDSARYANKTSDGKQKATDNILSLGAYTFEALNDAANGSFVVKRNGDWYETKANSNLYKIKGVKIRFDTNLGSNPNASITHFEAKETDSSSIPNEYWDKYKDSPLRKVSGNTAVYKMNVNSTTSERWDELFGTSGSIAQTDAANKWDVKPIMSNSSFLDGVYFATNRKQIADIMHRNYGDTYFADSYMIDPENWTSYNSTQAHKDAVADYHTEDADGNDTYGYDLTVAKTLFKKSADELVSSGTYKDGDKITLKAYYQAQTQITQWADTWAKSIEDAFNAANGHSLTLDIVNEAVTLWSDVYYKHMMVGQFDFGFGSISGNNFDPLNFMEVLKSDNSSGFTLNWGVDTDTPSNDLVFDGKAWSFDALFNAANSGALVSEGKMAVPYIYDDSKTKFTKEGVTVTFNYNNDLIKAANIDLTSLTAQIVFSYVNGNDVVSSTDSLYAARFISVDTANIDETNHTVSFTLSADQILSDTYLGLEIDKIGTANADASVTKAYEDALAQAKADGKSEAEAEELALAAAQQACVPVAQKNVENLLTGAVGKQVSFRFSFVQNMTINGINGTNVVNVKGSGVGK